MNTDKKTNNQAVHFESRMQNLITCPYCWTDQRTERNFCFGCGAEFLYLDESLTAKIEPSR